MGTIDQRTSEAGLQTHLPAVSACFEHQVRRQPFLGGIMRLAFRLDPEGKVIKLTVTQSSVGSLQVERCVRHELSRARFAAPKGGEAEFTFPLTFSGVFSPRDWTPSSQLEKRLKKLLEKLGPPPNLALTFYVSRSGEVLSLGLSADEPIDDEVAETLSKGLRKMKFSGARWKVNKVTYRVD
jgi:TonB family protein